MSERAVPAKLEIVDYVCDKCGEGTMVRCSSMAYMTSPPQYDHRCTACGAQQTFHTSYPTSRIVKQEKS